MANSASRPHQGPAILSYGFRPFFLLGALYAAISMLLWLPLLWGEIALPSGFQPVDWHIHEMLFGFMAAITTGFLLTAVPNWTGRLPVRGRPLARLTALWCAGRLAVLCSGIIGAVPAAIIDGTFLLAVSLVIGREITAGRNWRNLKVLVPVVTLFAANLLFHIEALTTGTTDLARRLAIAASVTLIMIIGGRIIPSFTRNWLAREEPGRMPTAFNRFDATSMGMAVLALSAWTAAPESRLGGLLMLAAGVGQAVRLTRWAGERTLREPLVLVLHVSYLFIPLGFVLAGLSSLFADAVPAAAGLHAVGAGAIGTMALSVMMRASLGHTGHRLVMDRRSRLLFLLLMLATACRILAAFDADHFTLLVAGSGLAWALSFAGFSLFYGPILVRR
ncbi:NnrS family protein [Rhizobium straminoryzae]|uniref:Short-chain dehydrogenase n=1 Tax=Rhizobium straminoryzae TaxID=1387186 RepID=A0A549T6Q7_9HYPH|nr:NnrS family protein [Rhizobium straminoryzae]TRL37554.1 short-chain dehydrogenase [Rhizobium straminoryzae]